MHSPFFPTLLLACLPAVTYVVVLARYFSPCVPAHPSVLPGQANVEPTCLVYRREGRELLLSRIRVSRRVRRDSSRGIVHAFHGSHVIQLQLQLQLQLHAQTR
jgi:hypothetical protein